MKFNKLLIWAIVFIIIIGTIAFLYAFITIGSEPSVLIGFFYGFFGTELFNLARIKVHEIKQIKKVETENTNETGGNING